MLLSNFQLDQTEKRYAERQSRRVRNERLIREKRYLEVDNPDRVQKFLARRGLRIDIEKKTIIDKPSTVMAGETQGLAPDAVLERILGTNDLMGVAFLDEGLRVSRTIARILVSVSGGQAAAFATGFMVSPRLLMTNHHVLENDSSARSSLAEFNYQRRGDGTLIGSSVFQLDPDTFFFNDQVLDYALVAVRGQDATGRALADFGYNLLSEDEGKAIAAQWGNIIQHPGGEPKQVSLRENQIVDVLTSFIHYKTDTAPGSSGAAVFNDRWEIVALHHSGVPAKTPDGRTMAVNGEPWRPEMGEDRIKWIANEGVRISCIIKDLRDRITNPAQRALFDAMLVSGKDVSPLVSSPVAAPISSPGESRPAATVGQDSSAVWSIPPLTITVNVGGGAAAAAAAPGAAAPGAAAVLASVPAGPPPAPAAKLEDRNPKEILAAAQTALKQNRPNVMRVRLGYVFQDGRITKERALVVTVRQKKSVAELNAAKMEELPPTFGGLKVQVTGPTIPELILAERGSAATEALALNVDALAAEITYKPPPAAHLSRVKAKMRVIAHVSPDAGWARLNAFLTGTTKTLVVGMYDFGAQHIIGAIVKAGHKKAFKKMTLALQPGQSLGDKTKEHDLKDKDTVHKLQQALRKKFEIAWVKVGIVNGWVASSYHIKVAARDQTAFWLSSGNWQSSNQPPPPIDPLKKPWDRSWLSKYNREWHAIVEHPGLTGQFQTYIQNDFKHNVRVGSEEAFVLPDLLVPEEAFAVTAAEKAATFQYFEPLDEKRVFDVQPLLTPDNFLDFVLPLVNSAKEELYIQNQTFNAPGDNQTKLKQLLSAVLAKQKAGVKVRIIFRILNQADARANLEGLQDFGFDMADIRVQKNCHTKGVVVDRQRVLIGSQNWSEQGISLNRDASLLFEDAKLAAYFAQIFEHDWQNLATDRIDSAPEIELAPAADASRPGYAKISVEEYLESL
jgi:Trypsin-like peptidase domain/PLD-like domain